MNQGVLNMKELEEYLPMNLLKNWFLYQIDARNTCVGIWDNSQMGFHYRRCKFNDVFLDVEYHYDIGTVNPDMERNGTAKPIKEIERAPKFNSGGEMMDYLKSHSEKIKKEQS